MLNRIFISNFLIIKEIDLDLSKGFNALTGETGSGKSLILDSISFCLYGKKLNNLIGNFATKTLVSLTFSVTSEITQALLDLNIDLEDDDELIITRQISSAKKTKLLVNNFPITQKQLNKLSEDLILIYGQHSFGNLFKPSFHLSVLDGFIEDKKLLTDVAYYSYEAKKLQQNIEDLEHKKIEAKQEEDYLKSAKNELQSLNIKDNEEQELCEKRALLKNKAKFSQMINSVLEDIRSMDASNKLPAILRRISRSSEAEKFDNIYSEIDKSLEHLCQAENLLEQMQNSEEIDMSLDEIEERLFEIRAVSRKYNISSANLLQYLQDIEDKLLNIKSYENNLSNLKKKFEDVKAEYFKFANQLSQIRAEKSSKIEEEVSNELKMLKMPECRFKVELHTKKDEIHSKGMDKVIFSASTNPGTPFGAIDKIASGGEMARFMLALQVALFSKSVKLPTIIFDEIDTGIGGAAADSVGTRLKKLSSNGAQLLIITHQPQVASKAENHFIITKHSNGEVTTTHVKSLQQEERVNEIARMLSGKEVNEAAINAAHSLLSAS